MKVCHVTSVHPALDARIFHKMCVSLSRAGYETYLAAPGESFEQSGVRVIGAGEKPASRVKRMLFFARKVYKTALAADADIYHLHDPELLPYALKLKRLGKRVIFDSHEDYVASITEKAWIFPPLRRIMAAYAAFTQKRVCARLDAVICVNSAQLERLKRINHNTYMITNYPIVREDGELPPCSRARVVCYAGGIVPQWMHENIISALEAANARYALAGQGSGEYMARLRALPGWERVDYAGKIPHTDVPAFIRSGAVALALLDYVKNANGRKGTLGNTKLFEYMLEGVPVVCTDFELWREIIEEENCGLCVNPHDVDAIARAVSYLLDNPVEAEAMGQNGRGAVLEKYNWRTQERILLEVYRGLAALS